MLIANLPNELSIEIPKNLVEKEIRIVDSFNVQSHNYIIGAKEANFQVIFTKKIEEIINKASSPQNGETLEILPEKQIRYEQRKVFMVTLNEQELSTWGSNDETLLKTIATKLGVQIESFTYLSNDKIV